MYKQHFSSEKYHKCLECAEVKLKVGAAQIETLGCYRMEWTSLAEKISRETSIPLGELKIIVAGKIMGSDNYKGLLQEYIFNILEKNLENN